MHHKQLSKEENVVAAHLAAVDPAVQPAFAQALLAGIPWMEILQLLLQGGLKLLQDAIAAKTAGS